MAVILVVFMIMYKGAKVATGTPKITVTNTQKYWSKANFNEVLNNKS
jgi:multidrug resistance efflux pump